MRRRLQEARAIPADDSWEINRMSHVLEPLVPIVSYEELSPEFQARSRAARERLGVQINSVHACAHAEELGGAARDFLSSAMTLGSLSREDAPADPPRGVEREPVPLLHGAPEA